MLLRLVSSFSALLLIASACGGTAAPETTTTTSLAAQAEPEPAEDSTGQTSGATGSSACEAIFDEIIGVLTLVLADLDELTLEDPVERGEEVLDEYDAQLSGLFARATDQGCSTTTFCDKTDALEPHSAVAAQFYRILIADCVRENVGSGFCGQTADQALADLQIAMNVFADLEEEFTAEQQDEVRAAVDFLTGPFTAECVEEQAYFCEGAGRLDPVGEIAEFMHGVLEEFCGGFPARDTEAEPEPDSTSLDACELLTAEEVAEAAGIEIIGSDHGPNIPGVVPFSHICFYYPTEGFEVVTLKVITPNSIMIDPAPDDPQTYYEQNVIGEDVSGVGDAANWEAGFGNLLVMAEGVTLDISTGALRFEGVDEAGQEAIAVALAEIILSRLET